MDLFADGLVAINNRAERGCEPFDMTHDLAERAPFALLDAGVTWLIAEIGERIGDEVVGAAELPAIGERACKPLAPVTAAPAPAKAILVMPAPIAPKIVRAPLNAAICCTSGSEPGMIG